MKNLFLLSALSLTLLLVPTPTRVEARRGGVGGKVGPVGVRVGGRLGLAGLRGQRLQNLGLRLQNRGLRLQNRVFLAPFAAQRFVAAQHVNVAQRLLVANHYAAPVIVQQQLVAPSRVLLNKINTVTVAPLVSNANIAYTAPPVAYTAPPVVQQEVAPCPTCAPQYIQQPVVQYLQQPLVQYYQQPLAISTYSRRLFLSSCY